MTLVVPTPFAQLAFAMWPCIFLPLPLYRRYWAGTLALEDESVLVHEQVHIDREWAQGPIFFGWRYLTDRQYRLHEELVAIDVQMRFLKERGGTYNCERKARQFASTTYGHVLSYDESLKTLKRVWEDGYHDGSILNT